MADVKPSPSRALSPTHLVDTGQICWIECHNVEWKWISPDFGRFALKHKLLALDLDGTLLTDDKRISSRAITAIRAAIDAGVIVVFCTGRRYRTVIPIVTEMRRPILVAYNNGAAVRECPSHRLMQKTLFPSEHFASIVELLASFDLSPVLHVDSFDDGVDLYCSKSDTNRFHRQYVSRNFEFLREFDDLRFAPSDRIIQFIIMDQLAILSSVQKALSDGRNGWGLNVHIVRNLTIPASALEILNSQASKWHAIAEIADDIGISDDEIVAMGDDISDLGMIENAGVGIAVENALPEVKDAADEIVPSNNSDGVAIAIERYFL